MPEIPIYQVDAFSESVFGGNPAAVCPLETWLDDDTMQRVAAENNLSETAFLVRREDGDFDLRWFTPVVEVDLCGHATLASGRVVLEHLEPGRETVSFHTRSGRLRVATEGDRLVLDLPARPPRPTATPTLDDLAEALGARPVEVVAARDAIAIFETQADVASLVPDMARVAALDAFAVAATAPGDEFDFVSRFFAPARGVAEDPVTGSAHASLVPFWAGRLGKRSLVARQISARGGTLWCRLEGERVVLAGHSALYLEGRIRV